MDDLNFLSIGKQIKKQWKFENVTKRFAVNYVFIIYELLYIRYKPLKNSSLIFI